MAAFPTWAWCGCFPARGATASARQHPWPHAPRRGPRTTAGSRPASLPRRAPWERRVGSLRGADSSGKPRPGHALDSRANPGHVRRVTVSMESRAWRAGSRAWCVRKRDRSRIGKAARLPDLNINGAVSWHARPMMGRRCRRCTGYPSMRRKYSSSSQDQAVTNRRWPTVAAAWRLRRGDSAACHDGRCPGCHGA